MLDPLKRGLRSLESLTPGESATIDSIIFAALRALCGDLGIREGEAVRCRAGTANVIVLDTADGHTIPLERDWARYIRIVSPQPA